MADIITYPLYYTPYYSPSSGIVNLDGFIFHTTTSGDNYYFPLFIQYPFNLTRLYYKSTADRIEPVDIDRPFLTGLLYLPIDVTETYTTSGVLTLGFNYSNNVCFIPCLNDIPLNIGTNILDICYDGCYILVCTNSGVECLNSRTFESIWYFNSTIVQSTCSNQEIVCFGTVCSGVYYNDFPRAIENLGNFLAGCKKVDNLTSSGIVDICTTSNGFFVGGESGVDILTASSGLDLEVTCQLTCSGINSVAYSVDTGIYYWSTANTVYRADTCV